MRLGPLEIGLILVIVLVIFGPGKLPQVGQALGRGIRQFNKAKSGGEGELEAKPVVAAAKDEARKAAQV